MKRISQLVCVDANQPALHPCQVRVHVLELPLRPAHTEMFQQQRLNIPDEWAAPAEDHLDQQRLALAEGHTTVASNWLITPVLWQPQVVQRVASLVKCAEQAREWIIGIQARRDTDVAGNTFGERMLALVEAA